MKSWYVGSILVGVFIQVSLLIGGDVLAQDGAVPAAGSPGASSEAQCVGIIRARAVRFHYSDSAIGVPQSQILDEVVRILQSCVDRVVQIEGHTDAEGSKAFNQALSERRAQAVKDYLVKQGVNQERLTVVGFGNTRRLVSSATAKGRAVNRRVTLRFRKSI